MSSSKLATYVLAPLMLATAVVQTAKSQNNNKYAKRFTPKTMRVIDSTKKIDTVRQSTHMEFSAGLAPLLTANADSRRGLFMVGTKFAHTFGYRKDKKNKFEMSLSSQVFMGPMMGPDPNQYMKRPAFTGDYNKLTQYNGNVCIGLSTTMFTSKNVDVNLASRFGLGFFTMYGRGNEKKMDVGAQIDMGVNAMFAINKNLSVCAGVNTFFADKNNYFDVGASVGAVFKVFQRNTEKACPHYKRVPYVAPSASAAPTVK